jgi:hypothetical protein
MHPYRKVHHQYYQWYVLLFVVAVVKAIVHCKRLRITSDACLAVISFGFIILAVPK